ncbi:error-prone DNA polymerase [Rhodovulum sp. DZ06]|uniref:error-prone DNA polymerase n=1 Tax=Rhodovulum sp. DZ06 TaxID=3425126 RepID=UPI003D35433F
MRCAELSALSNFTFLTGASHPEEMARRAAELGLDAIAVADVNSVAGVVRAHQALKELARGREAAVRERDAPREAELEARAKRLAARRRAAGAGRAAGETEQPPPAAQATPDPASPRLGGAPETPIRTLPRLIPAARLRLVDGPDLTALPMDRAAWGRLTRLLSLGKRRAEKGGCILHEADILAHAAGIILLVHAPDPLQDPLQGHDPAAAARPFAARFPGDVFLLAAPRYDGADRARLPLLAAAARDAGAPLAASAEPLMHHGRRRRIADVLSCIRLSRPIDRLGRAAQPNAERRLRAPEEMLRLFEGHEDAVHRTAEIAARCRFDLDQLRYEYPSEAGEETAQERLVRLTEYGLRERYPDGIPAKVRALADKELALIGKLNYAPYFLTVRDIVAFAESRGILCQGRGSAANSITCYALRITAVGPDIASMVFERFVSEARDEPPDIDVDFEHERREEVIQHIYARYGRHRAGLCATVIHYRSRRALREVGRAMGLSEDVCGALASQIWGWSQTEATAERLAEIGLDPADRRLRQVLEIAAELIGFPRHLSQHVGGFIITEGRLDELVPIENAAMEDRTVIEWDKDDIDALGILKVDVLSLGMLTCIRKAFDLVELHGGQRWSLATLPPEDPAVYDMLCQADSIGVFQVESRAQMNFLPRMRPRRFYDLVIQVAIVRPGPIQGDMVHPYIRRRRGEEPVSFPSDALGEVLGKTLGVPLFQEQAMQIAIIGAGFSPTEADRLRRALATFRKSGTIHDFRTRFVSGMLANGYDQDFAERCFSQIEGFGEYGFPESHAASFALLVYASAWIKRHHPAAFACALLNAQPMGFYAPAQIVRDAREHGVEVRPPCVNHSYWDNTLERCSGSVSGFALRLGFRQIKGLKEEEARWIAAARGNGWRAPEDLARRAGVSPDTVQRLAEADAFADLGLSRREALWAAKAALPGELPPLFAGLLEGEGIEEPPVELPQMTPGEAVVEDYVAMRLSLRAHPVELLRAVLTPPPGGAAPLGGVEPPRAAAAGAAGRAPGAPVAPTPRRKSTERATTPAEAFPAPAGSAGAAHFSGAASLARAARSDALRDRAEGRATRRPTPGDGWEREGRKGESPLPSLAAPQGAPGPTILSAAPSGPWPRPPACLAAAQLPLPPQNARIAAAGLVIVRQRPGSAKGVVFITLEDETGVTNVIVWQKVYERFRREILSGRLLRVTGRIQREGQVVHLLADRIEDLSHLLDDLARAAPRIDPAGPTDEVKRPQEDVRARKGRGPQEAAPARGGRRPRPSAGHPRAQAGRLFPSDEGGGA